MLYGWIGWSNLAAAAYVEVDAAEILRQYGRRGGEASGEDRLVWVGCCR
jgi:hypothetical protein